MFVCELLTWDLSTCHGTCVAEFGGDGASLSKQGLRMVRADPPSACGALIGDYKNAIVLARRGQCLFSDKMAAGSAAGAAAVVIINERYARTDSTRHGDGMCLTT